MRTKNYLSTFGMSDLRSRMGVLGGKFPSNKELGSLVGRLYVLDSAKFSGGGEGEEKRTRLRPRGPSCPRLAEVIINSQT